MTAYATATLVREQALSIVVGFSKGQAKYQNAATIKILHEVVGVSDLYAWGFGARQFDEVTPKRVKLLVANDSSAKKEDVAAALPRFVGDLTYACDDESDAVAVGIAWLIDHRKLDTPYEEQKPKPKKKPVRKKEDTA